MNNPAEASCDLAPQRSLLATGLSGLLFCRRMVLLRLQGLICSIWCNGMSLRLSSFEARRSSMSTPAVPSATTPFLLLQAIGMCVSSLVFTPSEASREFKEHGLGSIVEWSPWVSQPVVTPLQLIAAIFLPSKVL